jgi:hypothetical protein
LPSGRRSALLLRLHSFEQVASNEHQISNEQEQEPASREYRHVCPQVDQNAGDSEEADHLKQGEEIPTNAA